MNDGWITLRKLVRDCMTRNALTKAMAAAHKFPPARTQQMLDKLVEDGEAMVITVVRRGEIGRRMYVPADAEIFIGRGIEQPPASQAFSGPSAEGKTDKSPT